jgi:hypothetical protein
MKTECRLHVIKRSGSEIISLATDSCTTLKLEQDVYHKIKVRIVQFSYRLTVFEVPLQLTARFIFGANPPKLEAAALLGCSCSEFERLQAVSSGEIIHAKGKSVSWRR